MTTQQYNVAKKYPFIFDDDLISLNTVGNYINMAKSCNVTELKILGLQYFIKDIKYIFSDIKRERKHKLDYLKNL